MPTSTATRGPNGWVATVPSAMTMISAERMKSVRIAPLIFCFSMARTSTFSSISAPASLPRRSASSASSAGVWKNLCQTFSKPS